MDARFRGHDVGEVKYAIAVTGTRETAIEYPSILEL